MKTYIFILTILVSLSGCVTTNIERVTDIKQNDTIVVVSTLGDEFTIKTVGYTVFGNNSFKIDSYDWKINDYIENQTLKKLSTNYSPIKSPLISARLEPVKNDSWKGQPQNIKNEVVLNEAKRLNAKYILLISPKVIGDVFYGTNQNLLTNGIYRRKGRIIQHAQIGFNIFDANTGKYVAGNGHGARNSYVSQPVSHNSFKSLDEVSEADKNQFKKTNEILINQLIDKTLSFMSFKTGT